MNDLTFPLLGALSSTEITQDNAAEQKLNELRKVIASELAPALRATAYPAKGRLEHALERCLADAATLAALPTLLGKACIGIVAENPSIMLDGLGVNSHNSWNRKTTLPRLVFDQKGQPSVEVLSHGGQTLSLATSMSDKSEHDRKALTDKEFETLLDLENDHIDPREVIAALVCMAPLKYAYSSFLILPPGEFCRPGSGKLIGQCDAMIILGNLDNNESIRILRDNFTMPIYFVTDKPANLIQNTVEYLRSRYAGRIVEIVAQDDLNNLLVSLDNHVQRVTLHDRLLAETLNVEEYLSQQIAQRSALAESLKRDSVLFINDSLQDILEDTRKNLLDEIKALQEQGKNFAVARQNMLAEAVNAEKVLAKKAPTTGGDGTLRLHAGVMRPGALWRRIILRAIVSGHMNIAEEYQEKFWHVYPKQAFLTDLYLRKHKNQSITSDNIHQLREMPDSPEVLRAKIYFRQELGLTDQDCANIAALLPRCKDAAEKYFLALHLYEIYRQDKKSGKIDALPFATVLDAFRDAVLAGSEDAADIFVKYCGGENRFEEAREIADMGNPSGAYTYHLLALTKNDTPTANLYLKLAAALGNPKAVSKVAENCWNERVYGENISFDFKAGTVSGLDKQVMKAGASVYETLRNFPQMGVDVEYINERLGYFKFVLGQWRESRDLLGNTPHTVEGRFCLAIMYRYGHGGQQGRKEAIRLIREAENMQGPFAKFASYVKSGWLAQDAANL